MTENTTTYYSNGKLLLTGEYVVLDGALALALPSAYGQYLTVTGVNTGAIQWESLDEKGAVWFKAVFNAAALRESSSRTGLHGTAVSTSDKKTSDTLISILAAARKRNPDFPGPGGFRITTKLGFPGNWGLGSSSTLINNIAQWAKVDPYELLRNSFSGSGYDIACAQYNHPLTYRLIGKKPIVKPVAFYPPFASQLYFIHLNKKQDSRAGIRHYQAVKTGKAAAIQALSRITRKLPEAENLEAFEELMEEHEDRIARLIKLPKIKESRFSDYFGSIKSLGAWGGDFVLATGNPDTPAYFKEKGFTTVIPYGQMVLGNP